MSEYIKISDIPFRDLAEGHNTDIKVLVAFASDIASLSTIEIDDNADKEGEWIGGRVRSYPGYTCSLCGYSVEPWNTTKGCPHCRAKMKGTAE